MARKKMTLAELQAFEEKNKKLIESCDIIAYERLNFIQQRISELGILKVIPLDDMLRMGSRGVFLAGLSLLKTADVLYLTGNFSQKDFDNYTIFERKKVSEMAENTQRSVHVEGAPGALLRMYLLIPKLSFQTIQDVAQENGYRFEVSKRAVDLTERMIQTAQMYEWMTSNFKQRKLSSVDGFYETNWDAGHDYEETEQVCLKNIILLTAGLPREHVSSDLVNILFSGIFNRLQQNMLNLAEEAEAHEKNPVKLMQVLRSMRLLIQAVNHPVIPNLAQRKGLLYHAIRETGRCLGNAYADDPQWVAYTQQWLNRCTQNFVKRLPRKIKESQLNGPGIQKGKDELSHE